MEGRDGVEQARRAAASSDLLQDARQSVDPQALIVERHADEVGRQVARHAERQTVRGVFDKDRVAGPHEQCQQMVERSRVAGGDDYFVGAEGVAFRLRDAPGQGLAQHPAGLRWPRS